MIAYFLIIFICVFLTGNVLLIYLNKRVNGNRLPISKELNNSQLNNKLDLLNIKLNSKLDYIECRINEMGKK